MNVISHEDELMHLKPLFGPILTNDVQQQIAERIGLNNQSSLPSRKRSEERTRFLRCKQHVGSRSLYPQVGEATLLLGGSPPGGGNASALWERVLGGSPRIYAGDGALQRSGKSLDFDLMRFSAGEKSHAFSAGLKSSPPAEAGGLPPNNSADIS